MKESIEQGLERIVALMGELGESEAAPILETEGDELVVGVRCVRDGEAMEFTMAIKPGQEASVLRHLEALVRSDAARRVPGRN